MRLATPDDTTTVEQFYRFHSTGGLHARNHEYVKSMVAKEAFWIEENVNKDIEACIEVICLTSRADIELFFEDKCNMNLPTRAHTVPGQNVLQYTYQKNDVLVYWAGALVRPNSSGNFLQRVATNPLLIGHIGARKWRREREEWARQDLDHGDDNKNANRCPRPSRIIHSFGLLPDSIRTDTFPKLFELIHQGEKVWFLGKHASITPNGKSGEMYFWTCDVPLTVHQKERTKRNRYIITEIEQKRLLGTRVGFVGLSTGSVALESFLREGIGGFLRIADFDVYEISNGNRMLYHSSDQGKSKVDLCAKRIQEVDPYITIEKFSEGVYKDNIDLFAQDCDLIVEECDDFPIKALLRFAAEKYGIPLLMASSQNGLVDVERYDTDITTRPFHLDDRTILDEMASSSTMTAAEKNKVLSKLYDLQSAPARFMGSGIEIGKSISSWPQLAEEVFLNAAVLTHAARRILLGDRTVISGRFSMNMNDLFSPVNRVQTQEIEDLGGPGLTSFPRHHFALRVQEHRAIKELSFVGYWARSAPSGGNQQPWTTRMSIDSVDSEPCLEFYFRSGAVNIYGLEKSVREGWIDIALGTMLFNAEVAAAHLGKELHHKCAIDTSLNAKVALALTLSKPNEERAKTGVQEQNQLFDSLRHRTSARSSEPMAYIPLSLKEKLRAMGVIVVEEIDTADQSPHSVNEVRGAIIDERRKRL